MKRSIALVGALAVATAGLSVAAPAQAKTINVCVKKSNGNVKFITKKNKKCKTGWVKRSWNTDKTQGPLSVGPIGPTGPAGPNWSVKDASGQTLGTYGGFFYGGPFLPYLGVYVGDGGLFMYRSDGTLINDNTFLYFQNNTCTQATSPPASNAALEPFLKSAGGSGRAVFQLLNASTTQAWRIAETTTATVPVAANSLFQKNGTTGVCAAAAHAANFVIPLTPAEAPKVANGGLRVVR